MKTKIIKVVIIIIVFILQASFVHAQFNQTSVGLDWYGRTNGAPTNISAIGIGNFTTSPLSALNVNSFLLPASTVFTSGNLIRTDGTNTIDNLWQMFTGTTATNVTEKGRLFTTNTFPATLNDFNIRATAGSMYFNLYG